MRLHFLWVAAAAVLISGNAYADSFDHFLITGSGYFWSFNLSQVPQVVVRPGKFGYNDVAATVSGPGNLLQTAFYDIYFTLTDLTVLTVFCDPLHTCVNPVPGSLYISGVFSGPVSHPTFDPGTYSDLFGDRILTITAVPESSAIGMAGIAMLFLYCAISFSWRLPESNPKRHS